MTTKDVGTKSEVIRHNKHPSAFSQCRRILKLKKYVSNEMCQSFCKKWLNFEILIKCVLIGSQLRSAWSGYPPDLFFFFYAAKIPSTVHCNLIKAINQIYMYRICKMEESYRFNWILNFSSNIQMSQSYQINKLYRNGIFCFWPYDNWIYIISWHTNNNNNKKYKKKAAI